MKLLFLTTYGVFINHDHFFTRNVIRHLGIYCQSHNDLEMECVTLLPTNEVPEAILTDTPELGNEFGVNYKVYNYPDTWTSERQISAIATLFNAIAPDVIHSNMIEGLDVKAARLANIPIFLTIHIGGFICPRGGGNGLLRYDNTICDSGICNECYKCVISDLPFPRFGFAAYRLFNNTSISSYFANKRKPTWYLSTLFRTDNRIKERKECIADFRYAHLIVANQKLGNLLKKYVPANQTHVIPHGVAPRKRLPLPSLKGPVHFYILSRIQYSKGIVEALKAFRDIPHNQYQLHIIGDAGTSLYDRMYMKKVLMTARGINVIFHGKIPNAEIESVIKECHIMIHNAFFHEVFGINISESLSMGRGVLATKCGGSEMQIQDGVNGILYEPHSITALHTVLLEIINNKHLIQKFSDSAELRMPIQNYVNELVSLYHNVSGY